MARRLKAGDKVGQWTLGERLARGGNANIFNAIADDGSEAVVKMLQQHVLQEHDQPRGAKKIQRFLREICFYRDHRDLKGILPHLDSFVPEKPSEDAPPWLVTKLALPADKAFFPGNSDFVSAVSFTATVARTLVGLHERQIFHRDLKPENLFLLKEEPLIGDFGLVQIPELEPITEDGELVGPMFYVAPEMISYGANSYGGPADVYSLAKTLWVLATGQRYPLPGEQRASEPALTLSAYVNHSRAILLDPVIELATSILPARRPTMAEFAEHLEEWLRQPVKAAKPGDLSHLRPTLAAALEPGRRAEERRIECERLMHEIFDVMQSHFRRAADRMYDSAAVPVRTVATNWTVFDLLSRDSTRYTGHQGNATAIAACSVLTRPDSLGNQDEKSVPEVHLWSGGGVSVAYDTKAIYLAAGHIAGFGDIKKIVWGEDAVCLNGSVQLENAITTLANGLLENQENALNAFAELCTELQADSPKKH